MMHNKMCGLTYESSITLNKKIIYEIFEGDVFVGQNIEVLE